MDPQGFIDQSPHELRLTLVDGGLDHNQFTILSCSARSISKLRVSAQVIGASHVISVQTPRFKFHEVFACMSIPGHESRALDKLTGSPVEHELPGVRYEFTARSIPWQDPEPAELVEIVALARELRSTQIGLVYEFNRGPFSVHPKTVIAVYGGENGNLVIETAHSYPTSGLVLSRSTFSHT